MKPRTDHDVDDASRTPDAPPAVELADEAFDVVAGASASRGATWLREDQGSTQSDPDQPIILGRLYHPT